MDVKKEKAPRRMTERSAKQSRKDIKSEEKVEKPYKTLKGRKGR